MGSISIYDSIDIFNVLWVFKIEIFAGTFAGVTVYSYFYRQIGLNEKKILDVLNKFEKLESIEKIMSSEDQLRLLWESIKELKGTLGSFKQEIRKDIKTLSSDIAYLKTSTAVIKTKLALYVGIAVFLVSLIIKIGEKLVF